ncbi:helicase MOV-10-like [Belonocnema kinseyi]|uniref:helicase MOV-10-like n=1 Tax=Belonocnema kinseyi TaxID=2817044 RepID=UPI00143DDA39|nr:helicase MOV-10-like [Belonocnema kinseyi]
MEVEVEHMKNKIVAVIREEVEVRADAKFQNVHRVGCKYMIRLLCGNWPIRAQHYAMSLVDQWKLSPLLCPVPSTVCGKPFELLKAGLFVNYFNYIFIDEAGQATQPETLIPLGLNKSYNCDGLPQLVLSGDPKQLGPVVMTKVGQHLLGESMLERLMNRVELYQKGEDNKYNPNFLTKLVRNYRSHDAILRIPNQLFYENELETFGGKEVHTAENWSMLPKKQFPIIFHAIHGKEEKSGSSTRS